MAALHVADVLADDAVYTSREDARTGKLDSGFIQSAGLTEQLGRWRALASEVKAPCTRQRQVKCKISRKTRRAHARA